MSVIASLITSLTIVYSSVYSGADQRKHQSSASLAFVRGIHRRPVNSPHKGPVTRKMFPFDDVIMCWYDIWEEDFRKCWSNLLNYTGFPFTYRLTGSGIRVWLIDFIHINVWYLYMIHYCDVIMGEVASQITSLTIVYSNVYSDADQRKHHSSASLAFVPEIHRGPVNSQHKLSVTRKMLPFDDVIM